MTNMKRVTIALPETTDEKILELRRDNRFIRCSYSEIVRQAMEHGLALLQAEAAGPSTSRPAGTDSA